MTDGKRRRDKPGTEQALIDAVHQLLARDGVLVGLNMQQVADTAGVSRGLIHHHFGSPRALIRAALHAQLDRRTPKGQDGVQHASKHPEHARALALLLLDRDNTVDALPQATERLDVLTGEGETDPEAQVVLQDALALGYSLLREQAAAQLGIKVSRLDARVGTAWRERSAASSRAIASRATAPYH